MKDIELSSSSDVHNVSKQRTIIALILLPDPLMRNCRTET